MLKNERGLTLIELLVSVVILGIVITLFVTVNGSTRNSSTLSQDSFTALTIAEQGINSVRSQALANPNQNPDQLVYQSTDSRYTVHITRNVFTVNSGNPISMATSISPDKHSVSLDTIVNLSSGGSSLTPYLINLTVSWGGP